MFDVTLNFSCFNSGSETLDGHQLVNTVKKIIPDAEIYFNESILLFSLWSL